MPEQNLLDIIFLSFDETGSDRNWLDLKARFPRSKRVHGVQGVVEAHIRAAEKSATDFFFIVDGDNRVLPEFQFETPSTDLDRGTLYVYRCRNPLVDLVYGYGAVKIYNKSLLKDIDPMTVGDLATSVCKTYKIIHEVASETYFFTTPEEAWRGAFRECYKLASSQIKGQVQKETTERLNKWCQFDSDLTNSAWVKLGAQQGKQVAEQGSITREKINNFQWLGEYFNEHARI